MSNQISLLFFEKSKANAPKDMVPCFYHRICGSLCGKHIVFQKPQPRLAYGGHCDSIGSHGAILVGCL